MMTSVTNSADMDYRACIIVPNMCSCPCLFAQILVFTQCEGEICSLLCHTESGDMKTADCCGKSQARVVFERPLELMERIYVHIFLLCSINKQYDVSKDALGFFLIFLFLRCHPLLVHFGPFIYNGEICPPSTLHLEFASSLVHLKISQSLNSSCFSL